MTTKSDTTSKAGATGPKAPWNGALPFETIAEESPRELRQRRRGLDHRGEGLWRHRQRLVRLCQRGDGGTGRRN